MNQAVSVPRLRLLGAAALFSTGGAVIKSASFSGWQVAGLRSLVAGVALLLLFPEARRGVSWRSALVGLAYASTLVIFVVANKLTTAANTIFLQSTAPLYLLLLGPWLLKERFQSRDLAQVAVIALGMTLFLLGQEAPRASATDPATGDLLAAASGVTWALTLLGLRWLGRSGQRGESAVLVGNFLAFLVAAPFLLPFGEVAPLDWGLIAFLGVFQIGLAYVLLTAALRALPALEAAVLLLVEPVLSLLWAWIIHGEAPGPLPLSGGALISAATLAKSIADARRDSRAAPPPSV
jgi:drug/metabolite transporter (DMT)-like permease